jgi:hypothetical protein
MKGCRHVRFRSHCGQELLTSRISGFDPERLFAAFSYCIARGSFVDAGCLGQNGIRRTDLYGTSAGVARSLGLDARELHDLAPFVDFGREHRSEVGE